MMLVQEFVEFRAITFCNARRLGHITIGDLQQLRQVFTLEAGPRIGKGRHFAISLAAQSTLHQAGLVSTMWW